MPKSLLSDAGRELFGVGFVSLLVKTVSTFGADCVHSFTALTQGHQLCCISMTKQRVLNLSDEEQAKASSLLRTLLQ